MELKYRLPSQKTLVGAIVVLIVILIICFGTHGQSFKREISLLDSHGRVKAYRNSIVHSGTETIIAQKGKVDRERLKPGEWFVVHEFGEYRGSEPEITDVEALTVTSEGFSIPEQAAIKRALESWNVNGIRFVYQEDGQVKIKRQKLSTMALSVMQIEGETVVSASILVDPHVTSLDALQSVISHEMGHVLGLPDNHDHNSIMYFKSRGRNRDNGRTTPSAEDLATAQSLPAAPRQ